MAVTDSISALASGTYVVTRYAAGSWSGGDYTSGATSTVNAKGSLQPLNGRDLQVLPEGQHAEDVRKLWTTTPVYTRRPGDLSPDRVAIDGEAFEVFRVETWEAFGTTHYVVFASRVVKP